MSWTLLTKQGRVDVHQATVLGRDNFSGHPSLSRRHFEITLREGKCFLKDLGSTNGIFIRGKKLEPNTSVELKPNEVFLAGDLEIVAALGAAQPARHLAFAAIAAAAVLAVFLIMINGRGMDHGKSLGPWILFSVFVISSFSVGTVYSAFWFFSPKAGWSSRRLVLSVIAFFALSLLVNHAMFALSDRVMGLTEEIAGAQVEYYCVNHFVAPKCIDMIVLCPPCATRLPAPVRQTIGKRIDPFVRQATAAASAEKSRQPATSSSVLPKVVR